MTNVSDNAELDTVPQSKPFPFGSMVIFYLAFVVWYPGLLVSTFVFIPELHELDFFEDAEGIIPTTDDVVTKLFGSEVAAHIQTTEQKWTWYWGLVAVCSLALMMAASQGFLREKPLLLAAIPAFMAFVPLAVLAALATPLRCAKRYWLPTSILYLGLGAIAAYFSYKNIWVADEGALLANFGLQVGLACIAGALLKFAVSIWSQFDNVFTAEPTVASRATLFE